MVVAIPLPFVIKRYKEDISLVEVFDNILTIFQTGYLPA